MRQDSFVNLRISAEIRKRLESLLSDEITLSALIREVLRSHLDLVEPISDLKK